MTDVSNEKFQGRFHWTPGKIMLAETFVAMIGIILLVPVMFLGIGLSAAKESDVPWWLNLYAGDLLLIGLAVISIPVTGIIALILWLARDKVIEELTTNTPGPPFLAASPPRVGCKDSAPHSTH